MGLGGAAFLAGSRIRSIFRREMSNEEFIEMFKEEERRREESRRKYMESRFGKPICK